MFSNHISLGFEHAVLITLVFQRLKSGNELTEISSATCYQACLAVEPARLFLKRLTELLIDPAILFLNMYPKGNESICAHNNLYTNIPNIIYNGPKLRGVNIPFTDLGQL